MMNLASTLWIIYPKFCGSSAHITSASIKWSDASLQEMTRMTCEAKIELTSGLSTQHLHHPAQEACQLGLYLDPPLPPQPAQYEFHV